MRLSVIIVAYNSNDEVGDCLATVDRFNPYGRDLEVVVVDNKPDTGLREMIEATACGFSFRYVPNPANDGFGAGNNRGVEVAASDKVFFLNPDTLLLDNHVLARTVEKLDENPDRVVGYTLVDRAGALNNSYSYFFEDFLLFPLFDFIRKRDFYACNRLRFLQRRVWPWGAAFAMNKAAFVKAGCFDERIFLCNEEPDLMKRLPARQVEILPERIVHLEGHGREVPVSRYLAFYRSLDYYFTKYRLPARRYWRFLAFTFWVKRLLRRPVDPNMTAAYAQFREKR